MALKYAVTGDPAAKAKAEHFYSGMRLLNTITGIKGLMARSAVAPGESHGSGAWHPSTVSQYKVGVWGLQHQPRLHLAPLSLVIQLHQPLLAGVDLERRYKL